jgi:tRNA(His) guanylyltransferase
MGSTVKPKADTLGDRMKKYENITRFSLPPRTYTILRVDGRAFHTWTRGLNRPYDTQLIDCINEAAIVLCEQISGSLFAFAQSDEISVLAVDFKDIKSQSWFDGNIQKWVSVGASIATAAFNERVSYYNSDRNTTTLGSKKRPTATFDARVYTIPDFVEVENYFVWRQQDAERNSVTMLAQNYASHKQLHGKNRAAQHEIIHKAGDNWAKHPTRFKHGAMIRKKCGALELSTGQRVRLESSNWFVDDETPIFTRKRDYLRELIPVPWENDMIVRKAAAGE